MKQLRIQLLIFLLGCITVKGITQVDLSNCIKPVYQGKESTRLSLYNTNPESPDGKKLCFIQYPEIGHGGKEIVQADVLIKDLTSGKTEKIYEVRCTNHNGANTIWVNDSIIAFQVEYKRAFVLFNISTNKSLSGLINGELPHFSYDNVIYYSIADAQFSADGKRVYFTMAIDKQDRFEAVFIDLSKVKLFES